MTTAPPRSSMPKTGGFSVANVPRPRAPFSRRRLGFRPFFDRLRVPFVPGDEIDFVTLDCAAQGRIRLEGHDACAQLRGHLMSVAG